MDFEKVLGHEEIVKSLKEIIVDNKEGHAYVFSGPSGVGKNTIAKVFSKALLCTNIINGNPCGRCVSCKSFESSSNPDFYMTDSSLSSIGVDAIRDIQKRAKVKPYYSQKNVFLIPNADKMTIQAQNCILKTLEDPPGHTVIILTARNYEYFLETIKSRLVRYNMKPNTQSEVYEYIKTHTKENDLSKIKFIASCTGGSIGKALELINSNDFVSIRDKTINILLEVNKGDFEVAMKYSDFFEKNKQSIDVILEIMLLFYRDLLVIKNNADKGDLINKDKTDVIFSSASDFSIKKLLKNIDCIYRVAHRLNRNVNYNIATNNMLMEIQEVRY